MFLSKADYEKFLANLKDAAARFSVVVRSDVLMGNHYHLVVETPKANLSSFMHAVQSGYTTYFKREGSCPQSTGRPRDDGSEEVRKMNRHTIPLGRILGIPIGLDYSWFLIFGLITWTMAVGYYPAEFKDWPAAAVLDRGRGDRHHAVCECTAA